ncbi:MAG: c-type cytochrome [Arenimonas sp.]
MRHTFLLWVALLGPLAGVAAPPRPAKLGQCVACHGETGRGRVAGTPHLGGQDESFLRRALWAYRAGKRQAAPMNSIANTLQPRDITALALWYSQQDGLNRP